MSLRFFQFQNSGNRSGSDFRAEVEQFPGVGFRAQDSEGGDW